MYTEEQEKIARLLLKGQKTVEDLRDELDMPAADLLSGLKELIKLRVVEKQGNNYKLIDKITATASDDIEEHFKLHMIIEGSGPEKDAVEKQMNLMTQRLKADRIKITMFEKSEMLKTDVGYNQHIDIEFYVPEFQDAVKMVMNYGPTIVEVLEPRETEITAETMERALQELTASVHYYSEWIAKYEMAVQELTKKLKETAGVENVLFRDTTQKKSRS
ncbi:MAG: hypothetical protein J4432_00575 [DPANN group archaeon]|nr:hypothetical protein [DPANN group archaeon]